MNECNCNDDYEKVKTNSQDSWPKYKFCYIKGPKGDIGDTGPTGPKGEDGACTIDIGETETLEAHEKAMVSNTGTSEHVILNFKIPSGYNGKDGDTIVIGKTETLDANAKAKVIDTQIGSTHTLDFYIPQGFDGVNGTPGPKGDTGKSEGIAIANTVTLEANEKAAVSDNFDGTTHNLTFSIPKGEKGEEGAPGSAVIDTYANIYEDNGNSYSLTANKSNQVELSKVGQNKNFNVSFTNGLKTKAEGIYKIDYFFEATASTSANISVEVRMDNVTMPGTKITKKVNNQEYASFTGSIIASISKDVLIDLAVSSSANVTLTPDEAVVSYLNIIKLS